MRVIKIKNRSALQLGIMLIMGLLASSSNATLLPRTTAATPYASVQGWILEAIWVSRNSNRSVWRSQFEDLVEDQLFEALLAAGISAELIINAAREIENASVRTGGDEEEAIELKSHIRQMMAYLISAAEEFIENFYCTSCKAVETKLQEKKV